ncbi:MAG: hypothetical protein H7068_05540 [Pedobacter sp.]|nr:hypothetical protein [Chitinophagaceae bacterium]
MKTNLSLTILGIATLGLLLSGCKKMAEETQDIYKYTPQPAEPLSDTNIPCTSTSIKGTMLTGKTYTISCDKYVNAGDTLTIQPGVKVNFLNGAGIIVSGSFFSLGTKEQPNYLTVDGVAKNDAPTINFKASTDPAFDGKWKGILGTNTSAFMIFKWTHLEYVGAALGINGSTAYTVLGLASTDPSYGVYFQNPTGTFVFEDSWIYGSVDDAIRVTGGKMAIFRSTFEKCGKNGGDVLNIKSGGYGDMAFNFFIGNATNSLKASDKGAAPGLAQCNVRIYNNTIINGGFRQAKTGRGGSINFEEGARGKAFNNLIVNCRFGLRILSNVAADTAYLYNGNYGYNYYWTDSLSGANQIYPTTYITKPQPNDFPAPSSYLPTNFNYLNNTGYDGASAVQKGNPLFFNYPLPLTGGYRLQDIVAIGNFKFTLQPNSPCIGKAYTGFTPFQVVATDPIYGVTDFSQPGRDMGCYQSNGTGNQHF